MTPRVNDTTPNTITISYGESIDIRSIFIHVTWLASLPSVASRKGSLPGFVHSKSYLNPRDRILGYSQSSNADRVLARLRGRRKDIAFGITNDLDETVCLLVRSSVCCRFNPTLPPQRRPADNANFAHSGTVGPSRWPLTAWIHTLYSWVFDSSGGELRFKCFHEFPQGFSRG